jgi:predicted transposase/invertase (TIGR01784 family)
MTTTAERWIEQGIEQGIEKGVEQGVENEKLDTAKNMLKEGFEIKVIGKITGLSLDVIIELEK